ncbi:FecR domain-containing protein [Pedobacter sp.]|uniref:FecR family protein n=1 Tax=Pedobacter sp. TaxID=1411316 RepID=UPI0031D56192
MNKQQAAELLDKYLSGECTTEEYGILIRAYNKQALSDNIEPSDDEYDASKKRIFDHLQKKNPAILPAKIVRWRRIAVMAAASVLFAAFIYFFNTSDPAVYTKNTKLPIAQHDVGPGENRAKLILSNGKTIDLSNKKSGIVVGKELTYDDHSAVLTEQEESLSNTTLIASTPRGGTYKFTLPDGTAVWLNADTKLSFPYRFKGTKREVQLEGEAYFEVSKDRSRPFIVKTSNQKVEVLGTHFNIKSYRDEAEVKTTLLEGSVVVTPDFGAGKILSPGQQAVLSDQKLNMVSADINSVVAWKNGDFFFSGQNIEEAMRTISRWYDVKIEYRAKPKNIRLEGEVSRDKKLSTILKVLEKTSGNKFSISDKKVIVE